MVALIETVLYGESLRMAELYSAAWKREWDKVEVPIPL